MASALANRTSGDDTDYDVIDVTAQEISAPTITTFVPMETGLRAYDHPNDEKSADLRELEAKAAALRLLKEFPQISTAEVGTLIDEFRLDDDFEWPEETGDDAADDAATGEAMTRLPSNLLLDKVQRIAEVEYGRVHQGDDWPEVKAEKQRRRAVEAERRRDIDAQIARADAQTPTDAREPESRFEVPSSVIETGEVDALRARNAELLARLDVAATGAGYSRLQRAMDRDVWAMLGAAGKTITETDRLVALARLVDTDAKTRVTFTSREHIAKRANLNETTVKRSDDALESAGILVIVKHGGRGRGNSNRYRFAKSQ